MLAAYSANCSDVGGLKPALQDSIKDKLISLWKMLNHQTCSRSSLQLTMSSERPNDLELEAFGLKSVTQGWVLYYGDEECLNGDFRGLVWNGRQKHDATLQNNCWNNSAGPEILHPLPACLALCLSGVHGSDMVFRTEEYKLSDLECYVSSISFN
jgi:hypothetical protein